MRLHHTIGIGLALFALVGPSRGAERQLLPVISTDGVTNFLANSSFEGGEGWGCSAGKYFGWTADVFRRVGQWDDSQAVHGKRSWKVTLSADKPLKIYGGYALLGAEVRT